MGQSNSKGKKRVSLREKWQRKHALVPGPPLHMDMPVPAPLPGGVAVPAVNKELTVDNIEVKRKEFTGEAPKNVSDATQAYAVGASSKHNLEMDLAHLDVPIVQVYCQPEMVKQLEDVNPYDILAVLKKPVDWEMYLQHGVGYGGYQQYSGVEQLDSPLRSLLDYSETNSNAAPDIKVKMRFVAKAILDAGEETYGVIPMLATHGSVCNVMKEVGIRAAYGALADCIRSESDVNDPRNRTLQILYDFRELRVEKMYHAQELQGAPGDVVNTHNVVGYRNAIADYVGLARIPDPDTYENNNAVPMVPVYFERFYNMESVVRLVLQCLNEAPRKLDYGAVVSFLKYNRPEAFEEDAEDFLYHAFDDDGLFTEGCVYWLLFRMGVFREVEGAAVDVKALFPPLDDLQLSRSRDMMAASGHHAMEPQEDLMTSMGKEEQEDLLTSADLALSHKCQNCSHEDHQ